MGETTQTPPVHVRGAVRALLPAPAEPDREPWSAAREELYREIEARLTEDDFDELVRGHLLMCACPTCGRRLPGRRSPGWPVGVLRRQFCGRRCRAAERRAYRRRAVDA